MQKIPLSKCFVNAEVEEAALRALRSGQYILAKECQAFESELAAHAGTQHCILGSSCTMIVYMMHLAQGLKPGDEVIVPSHTALPTLEPLIHCGATPVFVDIDDTFCLDAAQVEAAVTPHPSGSSRSIFTGIRPIWIVYLTLPRAASSGCWKIAPRPTARLTRAGASARWAWPAVTPFSRRKI